MKTFIRRPGNKTKHLKHLVPLVPKEYGTYIEPFVGTGALFLHLLPEKWIINDLNSDIIGVWELVRDDPEYLIKEIDKFKKKFLPLNNEDKLKMCKNITTSISNEKGKKKKTVKYLTMVYCSFNSCIESKNGYTIAGLYSDIYTTNMAHIFAEKYKTKIIELGGILKDGNIYNEDYIKILKKAKKGDFVFLDPPYIRDAPYGFKYNKDESLDDKFLTRLEKELAKLDSKKVKWMMTQGNTSKARTMFSKYNIKEIENKASYKPSSKYIELLITNY